MFIRAMSRWTLWATVAFLLGTAAFLVACGGPTPTAEPPTPTGEPQPPPAEVAIECPYQQLWGSSAHADAVAPAFTHWNEEDPPEVPVECAKCHSTPGYLDFLGLDGTAAGAVDNAAPIGTVVTCIACHNEATAAMDSVVFPSGVEVAGLGDEARCMQCHQGRASSPTVDEAIAQVGVEDDTVSPDLGFINIHYFAAAATQYGGVALGGYQYAGKSYDARFSHVEGLNTCMDCHDPHSLELKVETCAVCHQGVASVEDLKNVRSLGSTVDYDGDGDTTEGVYYEIQSLQEILYAAIQDYAANVAGAAIAYDVHAYPYFFNDTNGNGAADADEAAFPNRYASWTPRLLRAAYNYQTSMKDPGAYAHGGKYIIQLLYDSIEDLDPDLVANLTRVDAGHFAGSEEAFRHWDEEGVVPGSCAKCHSAEGLPTSLQEGVNISVPPANGFLCTTCHDEANWPARYALEEVQFPSGATVTFENTDANLCLSCHQGRESTVSVNRRIGDAADDEVVQGLGFVNVHYFAAGASLFGSEVHGAYEYDGQTYAGRNVHVEGFTTCIQCHNAHALTLNEEACATCHAGITDPAEIRMDTTDYDGDGDTTEGIAGEIATIQEALYAAIQEYAANVAGTPIAYNPGRYPYFFIDANGNGTADPDEGDRYASWTPRLLRAAYNYQYVSKDPGAFAHNPTYILQILYDSLADVGGDVTGMVRP